MLPGEHIIKVRVRRNGDSRDIETIEMSPNASMIELFKKASKVLRLSQACVAYFADGSQVTAPRLIEDSDVITISSGEAFRMMRSSSSQLGQYLLGDLIGEGGFGRVIRASDATSGEKVAIKLLKKSSFRTAMDMSRAFDEIQTLRSLRHENVIALRGTVDANDHFGIAMELADGGDLLRLINSRGGMLSEDESKSLFFQVIEGLHYCHSKGIAHRDLKLENILLDSSGVVKIADFGLAEISRSNILADGAGTLPYLPPEALAQTGHIDPFKGDVWALGILLYAMTQGDLPFLKADSEICSILFSEGLKFPVLLSPERLVYTLLAIQPNNRPKTKEIKSSNWLANRVKKDPSIASQIISASSSSQTPASTD